MAMDGAAGAPAFGGIGRQGDQGFEVDAVLEVSLDGGRAHDLAGQDGHEAAVGLGAQETHRDLGAVGDGVVGKEPQDGGPGVLADPVELLWVLEEGIVQLQVTDVRIWVGDIEDAEAIGGLALVAGLEPDAIGEQGQLVGTGEGEIEARSGRRRGEPVQGPGWRLG